MNRVTYTLTLRPEPTNSDPIRSLRAVLKSALRNHGLRAIALREDMIVIEYRPAATELRLTGAAPIVTVTIAPALPADVSLNGLLLRFPDRCPRCDDDTAVIHDGVGPHAALLRCAGCDRFRGWLSRDTFRFVAETVRLFGRSDKPINVFRGPSRNHSQLRTP
jgi:hypothetical protein